MQGRLLFGRRFRVCGKDACSYYELDLVAGDRFGVEIFGADVGDVYAADADGRIKYHESPPDWLPAGDRMVRD